MKYKDQGLYLSESVKLLQGALKSKDRSLAWNDMARDETRDMDLKAELRTQQVLRTLFLSAA